MKNIYSILLSAIVLWGCADSDRDDPHDRPVLDIRITSAIDGVAATGTRAVPGTRAIHDDDALTGTGSVPGTRSAVGVNDALTGIKFIKKDGTGAPSSLSGASVSTGNRAGTAAGVITFTDAVPQYSLSNQNAYMVAYHPGVTAAGETATWSIDGKTDILLTPVWDAGTYTAPNTGASGSKLTFGHTLAQLEVICKAESGAALAVVQAAWGNITSIELASTLPQAKYTYATNAMTFVGTAAPKALLNADYNTAFAAIAMPASSSAAVSAAGMFAPSTGVFNLLVKTVGVPGGKTIPVQLTGGGNKDFEAGLRHTVTLTFKANSKDIVVSGTAITAWGTGYTAGSDVTI